MNDEIKNFSNMDDKKIIKNMKKITGKVSDARPILQHIYYNDNTIVATDSHRLLQINKKHNKTNVLYNAKTGENGESFQQYPETSRIIPESENANNKIIINHDEIDLLIAILKAYKGIKLDRLTLIIDKNQEYYLMNYSDFNFNNNELLEHLNLNYKLKNINLSDKPVHKITFNVSYLLNAFEYLKDDVKTKRVKSRLLCKMLYNVFTISTYQN
ncbi:phage protein [Staphylococcus aureus]|nr:phage protein [Staphylococcus aureus]